ncbi:MAG: efflux RND transporter periplasmic adaptor subunit, partial [Calditrichaeota bacterium]
LTIESQPEAEFIGTVKMISPVVDPTTGTAKVTIDIENHGGKLKPGMFASVYINTDTHRNTLLIPKKALLLESETDQVFVYDNGVARKANLKLGFISGDWVEVLSGLKEGDLVVTIGQEGLREGLPLKIPEQTAGLTSTSTDSVTRSIAKSQATANNTKKQPQGKIAFGQPNPERLKRMEERLLSIPEIRKEYEKRLKKDPELKDNPEKKMAFFREMFRKMRGQRRR